MISKHLFVPLTHSSCQFAYKIIVKNSHLFLDKKTITNFLNVALASSNFVCLRLNQLNERVHSFDT